MRFIRIRQKIVIVIAIFFSVFFLFPLSVSANAFDYVAEEVRPVLTALENARIALNERESSIRKTLVMEPWETDTEYHNRLEGAIHTGTAAEKERLRKKIELVIPSRYVRVEAGDYQRNARWWPVSIRTHLAGLLPSDEELEVRFFHDISLAEDIQKEYYYFENLLLTDTLGAQISYTVFLSDDLLVYVGKVSAISLVDLSTGRKIETQKIVWLPEQWFTADGPVTGEGESQIGGLSLGTLGPGGGVVFWDKRYYSDGWRYLEAAPDDLGGFIRWGVRGLSVEGTSAEVGTGEANTAAIAKRTGIINHAAKLCQDLVLGGVDDWFLPSKEELNLMYIHKDIIGDLNGEMYWSSSEYNETGAWYQNFIDGSQLVEVKDFHIRVRAIRAF